MPNSLFFKSIIYLVFAVQFLLSCSKKDVETNKVRKSAEVARVGQKTTDGIGLEFKDNVVNSVGNYYKSPIFVEIPREALIAGGASFNQEWQDFIANYKPFGVILNGYHCTSKKNVMALIKKIRELGGQDTIIAIDREGGRVDRLFWGNYKQWGHYPSPEEMGTLYEQYLKISSLSNDNKIKIAIKPDVKKLEKDFENIYDKMFKEMKNIGINMTFAPNCDVRSLHSDKFTIGTRSYSENPNTVSIIARIFVKSAIKNGIFVVPKHAPGLGSIAKDTHFEYAIIDKTREQIANTDMKPFIDIFREYKNNVHFILCPHVLYRSIDDQHISTKSQKFIDYIRANTKPDILILSDDLSMKAFNIKNSEFEKDISEIKSDIILTGIGRPLAEVIQIAELLKKKHNQKFINFLERRNNKNK